jgi:branched-chain amino acid transport system ATP-binding protein
VGVGRAFQNGSMFASLTVEENLLLGRHRLTRSGVIGSGLGLPSSRAEQRDARLKVRETAEFLEIDHLLARTSGDLSYGDAKRVDVARALSTEPRLLLLDEPAAGMHSREKVAMRSTINRIARELGTTILLVEHDMGVVMGISDRITVLDFGTVLITSSPEEVRNDPRVIEAYLGHSSARKGVPRLRRNGKR